MIVFSLRELYEVASRLRRERGGAALVFGALSPRTRNAQVGLYQAGEVDHLVATDAIGMGLNLDIDTVVFTGLTKFDGVGPRPLTPAEVGQIAGRAGRHVRDGQFAATDGARPARPAPRRGGRVAPLRAARPALLADRRARLLLAARPRSAASSASRRTRSSCACATPRTQRALAALTRDAEVMALARDPDAVRLLWEVCQVPDFQSVLTEAHTRLLSRVFRFLRGRRTGASRRTSSTRHVRELDRTEGEVDALLGRIAAIRTWTYLVQPRASGCPTRGSGRSGRARSRTGSPTRCTSG